MMPWLSSAWQRLIAYKHKGCIPSGLLLSGAASLGKKSLAHEYAKFVLCEQSNIDHACQQCRSCILFAAGNHPDFLMLAPEEKSSTIKIDQVRDLVATVGQTSGMGNYQVAIICYTEDMTKAAANALLKTLEEPRGKVLLLLLSHQPSRVSATIRSRCQEIKILPPSPSIAHQWLETQLPNDPNINVYLALSDFMPMPALQLAQQNQLQVRDTILTGLEQVQQGMLDPTKIAADCQAQPEVTVQYLMSLMLDMIKIKLHVSDFISHADKLSAVTSCAQRISLPTLLAMLDQVVDVARLLAQSNNLNVQLLLEKFFITWRYSHDAS